MPDSALLIPVKSFHLAKQRLSEYYRAEQRFYLALALAQRVVLSTKELDTFVVCDDSLVDRWAKSLGASVIFSNIAGLSAQVFVAVKQLHAMHYEQAIIVHSDLPKIGNLSGYANFDTMVIVPDLRKTGTNLLKISTDIPFEFHYGENSFLLHQKEALKRKIDYIILEDKNIGFDIDIPEDLDILGVDELESLLEEGLAIAEQNIF